MTATAVLSNRSQVRHIHGVNFDDCAICFNEINSRNPGKSVRFKKNDHVFIEHVCNDCYGDPEYKELMITNKAIAEDYKI